MLIVLDHGEPSVSHRVINSQRLARALGMLAGRTRQNRGELLGRRIERRSGSRSRLCASEFTRERRADLSLGDPRNWRFGGRRSWRGQARQSLGEGANVHDLSRLRLFAKLFNRLARRRTVCCNDVTVGEMASQPFDRKHLARLDDRAGGRRRMSRDPDLYQLHISGQLGLRLGRTRARVKPVSADIDPEPQREVNQRFGNRFLDRCAQRRWINRLLFVLSNDEKSLGMQSADEPDAGDVLGDDVRDQARQLAVDPADALSQQIRGTDVIGLQKRRRRELRAVKRLGLPIAYEFLGGHAMRSTRFENLCRLKSPRYRVTFSRVSDKAVGPLTGRRFRNEPSREPTYR